jgi:hypothetical protein
VVKSAQHSIRSGYGVTWQPGGLPSDAVVGEHA